MRRRNVTCRPLWLVPRDWIDRRHCCRWCRWSAVPLVVRLTCFRLPVVGFRADCVTTVKRCRRRRVMRLVTVEGRKNWWQSKTDGALENILDVGRYRATGRTFRQEGYRSIEIENGRGRRSVHDGVCGKGSRGNADSLQCDHPIPVNVPCHSTGDFHPWLNNYLAMLPPCTPSTHRLLYKLL